MHHSRQQTLLLIARIMGILLAVFLSLFAFDVFEMDGSLAEKLGGFLVHLLPTWLVLLAVSLSWRWAWLSGVLMIALAGLYVALFRVPVEAYLLLGGPAFLTGALFVWAWAAGNQVQAQT